MSCNNTDTRKIIKITNSVPKVVKGSNTLLEFKAGCLNDFFQVVEEYATQSIVLGASGGTSIVNEDMNFILIKAIWPSDALESEKKLELQLSDFDYVGGTGPLGATALSTEKIPFKDLFLVNSVENYEHLKFTNPTIHEVTLNLLKGKS